MNAACLALIAWLGAAVESAPLVDLAAARTAAVERVLENDPQLLGGHRGYLAWTGQHPSIAAAEDAFTGLLRTTGFSLPASRFDEALVRSPEIAARMDTCYVFLASNADARAAVDDLHRFELAHRTGRDTWGAVLTYLRAHPDEALTFLENPQWVKPIPETLRPLADAAREKDPSLERLQAAFQTLHEQPEAHLCVFPWWEAACDGESALRDAFDGLMAHFRQYPHRFWVWHRRELALAEAPDTRAWLRHWHRVVRRTKGLGRAYWDYLEALRAQPERAETAEARWRNEYGPAPQWPPEGQPPRLAPLPLPSRATPRVERPARIETDKPARPRIPASGPMKRPARPVPPARPVNEVENAGQDAETGGP